MGRNWGEGGRANMGRYKVIEGLGSKTSYKVEKSEEEEVGNTFGTMWMTSFWHQEIVNNN